MKFLTLTLAAAFFLCELALAAPSPMSGSSTPDATSGKAPLDDLATGLPQSKEVKTQPNHIRGTKRTSRMYDTEKPAATGNTKDEHMSGPHADY